MCVYLCSTTTQVHTHIAVSAFCCWSIFTKIFLTRSLPECVRVQHCCWWCTFDQVAWGANNTGSSPHAVFLKNGQLYFSRAGAVNIARSPGVCPSCEGDSGGFLQVFKSLNPRKLNGVCIQCIVCKLSHSSHYYCYVPPCFTFVPLCTPVRSFELIMNYCRQLTALTCHRKPHTAVKPNDTITPQQCCAKYHTILFHTISL